LPLIVAAESFPNYDRVRVLPNPVKISDFDLTSHTGETFRLSDLNGTVALVFFGFTNCPDVCPITMADFQQLYSSKLIPVDKVSFVLISVDGDRDSPQAMKTFLAKFSDDFIGLTGPSSEVKKLAKQFRSSFFKGAVDSVSGDYSIGHSPQSFVLDANGRLRAELYSPSVESMAGVLNHLLGEAATSE
jgi:protein SCO1/2